MNSEWKEKVEAAIRLFRYPFSQDVKLSYIQTEREISYIAGQCLAAEVVKLQAELDKKIKEDK